MRAWLSDWWMLVLLTGIARVACAVVAGAAQWLLLGLVASAILCCTPFRGSRAAPRATGARSAVGSHNKSSVDRLVHIDCDRNHLWTTDLL